MNYDLAFKEVLKEALKELARKSVVSQSKFVIGSIKRFVTSEEVKEVGLAFSVELLIKAAKQNLNEIKSEEPNPDDIIFMLYEYTVLETVNSLANDILAFYEQNKAASVDDICKGIEDIASKMQNEEYLDDKISKFIDEVKC